MKHDHDRTTRLFSGGMFVKASTLRYMSCHVHLKEHSEKGLQFGFYAGIHMMDCSTKF